MDIKDDLEQEVKLIFDQGGATHKVTYTINYFYTNNNRLWNLPKQSSHHCIMFREVEAAPHIVTCHVFVEEKQISLITKVFLFVMF
jgi:hypothetical protein